VRWKEFRVKPGGKFRLKDHDPSSDGGKGHSKEEAQERLQKSREELVHLQDLLYAQDEYALLLIFQAMDAAGKDSIVKHVLSGLNPAGCQVFAFKAPSSEELDHDFLWRTNKALPERGRIGVFNRSYYEEVLVVRVHPGILKAQRIPEALITKDLWKERYQDINAMERHLTRSGTVIRKFFLNVSKEEQKLRFLERLDEPEENWKFALGDLEQRKLWDPYQKAYEEAIAATSTDDAPWYVIPADRKWLTRMAVADIVVDTLKGLDLRYPQVPAKIKDALAEARKQLDPKG
jgi:PPK2 family polyphosphate:nucleotide phosphotransferase